MISGTQFQYFIPTKIMFGRGQIKNLHRCSLPGKKALIVITSGKSTRQHGYLEMVEEELTLAQIDYAIFDRVASNPLVQNIIEGATMAKEQQCDFIIGLGGGSPIDASKAIALMATNEGELWDYIAAGSGKGLSVQVKPLPVIAIVTTAGTGTEADPAFVVSKEDTKEKIGLYLPDLFPTIAIVDPELMTTVPPMFTAIQGFDALFHSTEGYISNKANWMSDMVALTAIEAISQNLVAAVLDGNNIKAREKVALGSTLSGIQMSVGSLTSEHSLEHAMSAYHQNLPHGAGLVLISVAYYKRFIHVPELSERFIRMARVIGRETATEPVDFLNALEQLIKDCGLSELKMSDYGITREEFITFAENARFTMGSKFLNDYVKLSDEDCVNIYEESFK